jgi:hypothetical protein
VTLRGTPPNRRSSGEGSTNTGVRTSYGQAYTAGSGESNEQVGSSGSVLFTFSYQIICLFHFGAQLLRRFYFLYRILVFITYRLFKVVTFPNLLSGSNPQFITFWRIGLIIGTVWQIVFIVVVGGT